MGKKLNANKVRQDVAHRYTERIRELEQELRDERLKRLEMQNELDRYSRLDVEYTKLRLFLGLNEDRIRKILEVIQFDETVGFSSLKPMFQQIIARRFPEINQEYRSIYKSIFGE